MSSGESAAAAHVATAAATQTPVPGGDQTATSITLYFAYGSNLSEVQMAARCPRSTAVGLARLRGWAWIINGRGYANVVEIGNDVGESSAGGAAAAAQRAGASSGTGPSSSPGGEGGGRGDCAEVYGLLYRLDPRDEEDLDRCEGVPSAYGKEVLDVEVVSWSPSPSNTAGRQERASDTATGATAAAAVASTTKRDASSTEVVKALVYVDRRRTTPDLPQEEYVARMNRGIDEAMQRWGLPLGYVDGVMRTFIPALPHSSSSCEDPFI